MKKSRKIRISGVDLKYFIDKSAVDDDGCSFPKVILYLPNNQKAWWNGCPSNIGNREVKEAVLSGRFYTNDGIFHLEPI